LAKKKHNLYSQLIYVLFYLHRHSIVLAIVVLPFTVSHRHSCRAVVVVAFAVAFTFAFVIAVAVAVAVTVAVVLSVVLAVSPSF